MRQTIDATHGEADYFTAVITENRGRSLSEATFKVALGGDLADETAWPSETDWRDADLVQEISAAQIRVGLFATSDDAGADRRLWVQLTLGDVVRVLVAAGDGNRLDVL